MSDSPFRKRVLRYAHKAVTAGAVAGTLAADKPPRHIFVDAVPEPAELPDGPRSLRRCQPVAAVGYVLEGSAQWEDEQHTVIRLKIEVHNDNVDGLQATEPTDAGGLRKIQQEGMSFLLTPKRGMRTIRLRTDVSCDGKPVGPREALGEWEFVITIPEKKADGSGDQPLRTEARPVFGTR